MNRYTEEEMNHQLWVGVWIGVGAETVILGVLIALGLYVGV